MNIPKRFAVFAAVLVVMLMAGCAAPAPISQSLFGQLPNGAVETPQTDSIIIALSERVTSLSPYLARNEGEELATGLIYEPLQNLLVEEKPVIVIAGDTLTLTVRLKPGQTFQDGTPVDEGVVLPDLPSDHWDSGPDGPCQVIMPTTPFPISTLTPLGPRPVRLAGQGDPLAIVYTAQVPLGVDIEAYAEQFKNTLLAQPVMKTGIDGQWYGTGPFSIGKVDAEGFVLEANTAHPGNQFQTELVFKTDPNGADFALGQGTFGGLDQRKIYSTSVGLANTLRTQGICDNCEIPLAPPCPTPTQ